MTVHQLAIWRTIHKLETRPRVARGLARTGCRRPRLRRDESGSATIEFVLWFLTLFVVLGLVMDTSLLLFKRAQAVQILQDVNRLRSVGALQSDSQTVDLITDQVVQYLTVPVEVRSQVVEGVIFSSIEMPTGDLQLFGFLSGMAGDFPVTVAAEQVIENLES